MPLESLRHLPVDDALGKALDDRRLADPGLADQHRVVLGPALQDLDGAPNLVVAPDYGIQATLLGALGEVDAELLERLALLLRVLAAHALPAAELFNRLFNSLLRRPVLGEGARAFPTRLQHREREQLARDELIPPLGGELVAQVQTTAELVAHGHVARIAVHGGRTIEDLAEPRAQPVDVDVGAGEQVPDTAPLLIEQCDENVGGLDRRVVPPHRETLGIGRARVGIGSSAGPCASRQPRIHAAREH